MQIQTENVSFPDTLPDNLFTIPNEYQIERSIGNQDFAELTGAVVTQQTEKAHNQVIAQNQPGFWTGIPQLLERTLTCLWEGLLAYGSWFFLTIGVALLLFCGVAKLKQRRIQ